MPDLQDDSFCNEHRLQYFVDRELFLDSPQLTQLLQPSFGHFLGRTIYTAHARKLIEASALSGSFERRTSFLTPYTGEVVGELPFPKVAGLPRLAVEVLGDLVPETATSNIAILEFNDARADGYDEFLLELRFSLGAFGAQVLDVPGAGKFVPLILSDKSTFEDWLDRRFAPMAGGSMGTQVIGIPPKYGATMTLPFLFKPMLHSMPKNSLTVNQRNWVPWGEVRREIEDMKIRGLPMMSTRRLSNGR